MANVLSSWWQKQRRRRQLRENREKGRAGEQIVRWRHETLWEKVERTGRGSDFRITRTRRNWRTGERKKSELIEVKTGPKSRLSELQRKTKKKKRHYKVERVDPPFY